MIITLFNKTTEAYTTEADIYNANWDDLVELLLCFTKVDKKTDAKMFNLWEFKSIEQGAEPGRRYHYINGVKQKTFDIVPNTIRRCGANAIGVWGLVLDCDNNWTLEQAAQDLSGFEYVLYTSFSHSDKQDKFRVVLPFTRMLTTKEFIAKEASIRSFFPQVDGASFSTSQAIYLHSGPDESKAISFHAKGAIIDPDVFENEVIEEINRSVYNINDSFTALSQKEVEAILDELKKYYPTLPYTVRRNVTWAVLDEIPNAYAIAVMRQRWPDYNLNGKYEMFVNDWKDNVISMGSVVHMIRQHNPNYMKPIKSNASLVSTAFGNKNKQLKQIFGV